MTDTDRPAIDELHEIVEGGRWAYEVATRVRRARVGTVGCT